MIFYSIILPEKFLNIICSGLSEYIISEYITIEQVSYTYNR